MLRDALIERCAPTLAGIKTGNLFSLETEETDMTQEIRRLNRVLVGKGLRLIPLRRSRKRTLIYLYRPEMLREDLIYPEAAQILEEKGYPCGDADRCVAELIRHLASDEEFPHEIGLFLGYPPSDVRGFMNSPWEGVRCVGCWKVYGDPMEAERLFAAYRRCTATYRSEVRNGKSLEHLIVTNRAGGWHQAANMEQ